MSRYGYNDSDESDLGLRQGDCSTLADVWDEEDVEYPDDDTILSRYSPGTARRMRRVALGEYPDEGEYTDEGDSGDEEVAVVEQGRPEAPAPLAHLPLYPELMHLVLLNSSLSTLARLLRVDKETHDLAAPLIYRTLYLWPPGELALGPFASGNMPQRRRFTSSRRGTAVSDQSSKEGHSRKNALLRYTQTLIIHRHTSEGCQVNTAQLQHLRLPRLQVWQFVCQGKMHPCMTQLNVTAPHRIYTEARQLQLLYNVLNPDIFPRSSEGLEHITVQYEAWCLTDHLDPIYDTSDSFEEYWLPSRYRETGDSDDDTVAEGIDDCGSVSKAGAAYTLKRYTIICTPDEATGMFGYRYSVHKPHAARYFRQALLDLLGHMPRDIEVEVVGAEWFSWELRVNNVVEAEEWSFEGDMRGLLRATKTIEVAYEGAEEARIDTRNERLVFTRLVDYLKTARAKEVFDEDVGEWQAWLADPKLQAPPKLTKEQLCCPQGYCKGEADGVGCFAGTSAMQDLEF